MGVEPVGLLHLERVTFTPAGIERGELVYSVPLAPGEEVNITHKEWANTSDELERIVTDSLEGFSEQGVTEKAEISQATMSQTQHTSGFNTGVTASGGFGPVNITSNFGYNVSDASTRSEQSSRRKTSDVTRRASTRAKQEHKFSFKVASAAGTEDQTVRRLRNPATDRAIRIDYYQLLRKWRVDLYRYGVRLTYDISIPEPGLAVLSKIRRIQELQDLLSKPNAPPTDFPASADAIRPEDYPRLLASFGGAPVEGLPARTTSMSVPDIKSFTDTHASESMPDYYPLSASIPDGYEVQSASLAYSVRTFRDPDNNHPGRFRVLLAGESSDVAQVNVPNDVSVPRTFRETDVDVTGLLGRSGDITLLYQASYLQDVAIALDLHLVLKDEVIDKWRLKAWTSLRDAVLAQQEVQRHGMRDELVRLQEELGGQDALSLRKAEREEVMRGVLRWLLGPAFEFHPAGVPAELYDERGGISRHNYETLSAFGEVIKFLHHAIEWENMTYIMYPYFWSHPDNWELKKYLRHPDLQHQAFLKAGSARVVLTIRPGFEREFVDFMSGYFTPASGTLPDGDDYVTIAEEMRLYALTNYPGIPPANPEDEARPLLTPRQRKAWDDMQAISRLLERHNAARGAYPTTEQGLAALSADAVTPTVPRLDPWGRPFVYTSPGVRGEYELASLGEDGAEGGEGEQADITSWAPASLIGRWYEYTPTSALDIGVAADLALPDA
jgi:hypothetical protein